MSHTSKAIGGPFNDMPIHLDAPRAPGEHVDVRRKHSRFLMANEFARYVMTGDNELHFVGIFNEGPPLVSEGTQYGVEMICPTCVKPVFGKECPVCAWKYVAPVIPDRPKPRFEPFNVGIFWFHVHEASDKSLSLTATDADDELIAILPGRWPGNLEEVHVKAIAGWWLLTQLQGWAAEAEKLYHACPTSICSLPDDDPQPVSESKAA
jgi:hypothetical protein